MKENTLSNIDDRQRGVTLIELLAALLIAGMLTGWGVGQWRHHQQTLRLEHTAQQLLAFLLRLQADANWRNRTTLLWFKNGTPWCLGGGVPPPDCASAEGSVFSPSYRDVVLSGYTDKEIGFYGLRNTAQAGHILLSNEAGGLRLVLSARGRLRLCSEGLRIRGDRAMLTVERGFTLPEVMLALVFGSVIALGAAKTYPLLRQQNVAVGQHFRLESTLRQLAFGIEKDLRRAGFCAGQCAGRPLLIGQAAGEAAGSCVIVAYDITRSGQWLTSGEDAGYFGYRLRNGGLEGQRGVSQCDGGGWERLLDRDEVQIERFHVAIERGEHGGALARLTLAGRSVGDARIRRSLSGSIEMAALP